MKYRKYDRTDFQEINSNQLILIPYCTSHNKCNVVLQSKVMSLYNSSGPKPALTDDSSEAPNK